MADDSLRTNLIRLASTMPKGSGERKAILGLLTASSTGRLVFHAETPRGGTVLKAYDEGTSFFWEETVRGRGLTRDWTASGSMSSVENLVIALNNHFRSYREFDPRKFKVFLDEIGVKV